MNFKNTKSGVIHAAETLRVTTNLKNRELLCSGRTVHYPLYKATNKPANCKNCIKLLKKERTKALKSDIKVDQKTELLDNSKGYKMVRILKKSVGNPLRKTPFDKYGVGFIFDPLDKMLRHDLKKPSNKIIHVRPTLLVGREYAFHETDIDYYFKSEQHVYIIEENNQWSTPIRRKNIVGKFLGWYYSPANNGYKYQILINGRKYDLPQGSIIPVNYSDSFKTGEVGYKLAKDFKPVDLFNHETPKDHEKESFFKWCLVNKINVDKPVKFDHHFIKKIESIPCFKEWLKKEGYIKEKFIPYKLELIIKSPGQFWDLFHRAYADPIHFENYKKGVINTFGISKIGIYDTPDQISRHLFNFKDYTLVCK
ncbi:MAG: hypothetical protein ACFFG0_01365 [Candidatus Thorarchaeota archaeon]